jgi:GNAT superfamily N-acetyltransferase
MTDRDGEYFLEKGNYGLRHYVHDRDEMAVCKLCWNNALPGGRTFPLIPEAGARSFGRIVTGPYARYALEYFYVADDLTSGKLIGYLTGAEGSFLETAEGQVSWATWRNSIAYRIAEEEFGEFSPKVCIPAYGFLEGVKFLYAVSLGPRAMQFLLHEKYNSDREMPKLPPGPEYHLQVHKGYRGLGIGSELIEHFLKQLEGEEHKTVSAQVTVCERQKSLDYYRRMSVGGAPLWSIYDRRETNIYTPEEKEAWDLGPVVENLSLVAERKRLLTFVTRES